MNDIKFHIFIYILAIILEFIIVFIIAISFNAIIHKNINIFITDIEIVAIYNVIFIAISLYRLFNSKGDIE